MQLSRCFLSIMQGQLKEPLNTDPCNETAMKLYFEELKANLDRKEYDAGAIALEIAPNTGTLHIQAYLEHKRKRIRTIANDLSCNLTNGIMQVKDARGSWEYCTGTGKHEGKHAISRMVWGEPRLHGSTENADLKMLVSAIMDGAQLQDIVKHNPYSWCVHRDRLIKFYNDWNFGVNSE